MQGVCLRQVYTPENKTKTDVDIIAIYSLDTKLLDMWIWRNPRDPNTPHVNWLEYLNMLPAWFPMA